MGRHRRAEGYASRDHQQAQQRDQCWPRRSQNERTPCRPRWLGPSPLARRIRKAHCGRNREVGEGDQVLGREGGLIRRSYRPGVSGLSARRLHIMRSRADCSRCLPVFRMNDENRSDAGKPNRGYRGRRSRSGWCLSFRALWPLSVGPRAAVQRNV